MASISSLSSSSSIYGNRNVLSGLASGMDTETMIENAVAGIKLKISGLQQKRTKVEWQQEAYRSIIDKMADFTNKYTSYASSTNLLSNSFFNSAVTVNPKGTFANLVAASGKTSSNVEILGVKQLAKAATYSVSGVGTTGGDTPTIQGGEMDLAQLQALSKVSGSLTINYGGSRSINLTFEQLDIYETAEELKNAIDEKLAEQNMTLSNGDSVSANAKIGVRVSGTGNIEFYDKAVAGNSVYISGASGDIRSTLGIDPTNKSSTLNTSGVKLYNEETTLADYLNGKEFSFTVDGLTKKITLEGIGSNTTGEDIIGQLQSKLDDAFGTKKVMVAQGSGGSSSHNGSSFCLSFTTQEGSTMSISGEAAKSLGLASENESTYVNTGKTLGELLGDDVWSSFNRTAAEGSRTLVGGTNGKESYYIDSSGNRVAKDATDGNWYRVDSDGNFLYEFTVNDQVVGRFSKEAALENVINSINNNTEAGVTVSYSKTTNEFQFVSRENGSAGRVEFGAGLAQSLFGAGEGRTVTQEVGQDAVFTMKVNNKVLENVARSSNSFDVDGLTVSLKGEFNYKRDDTGDYFLDEAGKRIDKDGYYVDETGKYVDVAGAVLPDGTAPVKGGQFVLDNIQEAVTFDSSADADKIVDAIKAMVQDYNAMVTEIKSAYSTQRAYKSNGSTYEPLTETDKEDMSESTIEAYEEKAKQGILFGDRDLATLYDRLRSAISVTGQDGADLRAIGITTSYSNGLTTLSLDENALRSALDTDPDKVRDVFTKSMDSGAATNGLMQALKSPLDTYGKVTGEKGILVQKAGSVRSPTSLYENILQNQLDEFDAQISRWEDKLSDQVDRYTTKFTQLEQLIAEMNSQSSAMMGLMSGNNGSY